MINFIINLIGIFLIFVAIDYKRPMEYRAKTFSKDWWIIILIVSLGSFLSSIKF
jgi:hypothetical protein